MLAIPSLAALALDNGSIIFPTDCRDWYHHHTTVYLQYQRRALGYRDHENSHRYKPKRASQNRPGGRTCFACHVAHAENNFLFPRGE
jgi:hypothetical protein